MSLRELPLMLIMTTGKGESSSVSVESKITFGSLCPPLRALHETCPCAPRWTELPTHSSPCMSSPPANPTSQVSRVSSSGAWAHTVLSWKASPLSLLSQMFVKRKTNSPPKILPSLPHFEIWLYEKSKKKYAHSQLVHCSVIN